jgi:hypothetical protein
MKIEKNYEAQLKNNKKNEQLNPSQPAKSTTQVIRLRQPHKK